MAILTNLCLVIFSLVGVGTAIAVPLSLNSRGKGAGSVSNYSGGASQPQFRVTKCSQSDTGWTSVGFGESNTREVCGAVDSQDSESVEMKAESKMSNLFSTMGGRKGESGSSKSGNLGRSQCATGISNQFILPTKDQSSGMEYVGLCDHSEQFTQGISVENKEQNSGGFTVKACSGDDCWKTQTSTQTEGMQGSTIKQLTSPNTDKGKTVTFKKKS